MILYFGSILIAKVDDQWQPMYTLILNTVYVNSANVCMEYKYSGTSI